MKKNSKATTISFRLSGALKDIVEYSLKSLGETKTEFIDRAIKDRLRNIAKSDPEIRKMVEATKKTVTAID